MKPSDVKAIEDRLRRAYERHRLKQAFVTFAPMLLLAAVATVLGRRYQIAVPAAALLFGLGVFALWYGRELGRGVLPGAIGGSLSLVLALCANHIGHWCTGDHCVSWCLPACITGGVLAGGLVGFVGVRQRRGAGYWVSSSAITLLTGTLGCSCVGYAGVGGMGLGFAGALAVSLVSSIGRKSANS